MMDLIELEGFSNAVGMHLESKWFALKRSSPDLFRTHNLATSPITPPKTKMLMNTRSFSVLLHALQQIKIRNT